MFAKPAIAAVLLAAAAAAAPDDAQALTCYVVFDRNDNVTYRDVYPPVDLSDAGRAERDAMRRRGEYLLFLEAEQCPRIEYFTGSAGSIGVELDQTLAPSQARREPAPAASSPTAAQPRTARKPAAPKR